MLKWNRIMLLSVVLLALLSTTLGTGPAQGQKKIIKGPVGPALGLPDRIRPELIDGVESIIEGVKQAGDILVVEMQPQKLRVWSLNPSGPPNIPAPAWIDLPANGLANINVTQAKGVYFSQTSPQLNYKISFTGNLARNKNPSPVYPIAVGSPSNTKISVFDNPGTNEAIEDAPVIYLQPNDPKLQKLASGQSSDILSFHKIAVETTVVMKQQSAQEYYTFQNKIQNHLIKSQQQAEKVRDNGLAVFAPFAAGVANPLGSITSLISDLSTKVQTDEQANSQVASSLDPNTSNSQIPNPQPIIDRCQAQAKEIEAKTQALAEYANAGANKAEAEKREPHPFDESGERRDEFMLGVEMDFDIEACAAVPNVTEATAPSAPIAETDYQTLGDRGEDLGNQLEAAANGFEANHPEDSLATSFSFDPVVTLSFEQKLLILALPLDSTGEIQAALTDFDSNTAVAGGSGSAQRSANGDGSQAKVSALRSDKCELSPISINIGGVGLIIGSPGNDSITGTNSPDLVLGLGGDDCIKSNGGMDVSLGMKGNDRIWGGKHHDLLAGGQGDDLIYGGSGKKYVIPTDPSGTSFVTVFLGNLISGGAGDDRLYGMDETFNSSSTEQYTDVIFGDGLAKAALMGNDTLDGQAGIDFLFGQRGEDTLSNQTPGKLVITNAQNPGGKDIPFGSFHFGGEGKDTISGSTSYDVAFGGQGDDAMLLGKEIDLAFGGLDNDTIDGQAGFDILFGGRGDDTLTGGKGGGGTSETEYDYELVFGGQGKDTILDEGGKLQLFFGGQDDDIVIARDGTNAIFGGQGRDYLTGGKGTDLVFGNNEADTIYGRDGIDFLFGNADRDMIYGGGGTVDLIAGGISDDLIRGGNNPNVANSTAPDKVDVIFGGAGNDLVFGDEKFDVAFGGKDNDCLWGGNGTDLLFGNDGNDCVNGEDGTDLLFGNDGDDWITAGTGVASLMGGGEGADTIKGGSGGDLILGGSGGDLIDADSGINLVFGGNDKDVIRAAGLTLSLGGDGDDCFNLSSGTHLAIGGAGNDQIKGNSSSLILGNAGDDLIASAAIAFGGDGNDRIKEVKLSFGQSDNDTIQMPATGLAFGGKGNDTINSGNNVGLIFGNQGNDSIYASGGGNIVFGGPDSDVITGYFSGDSSRDLLFGGAGSDTLYGNRKGDGAKDWLFSGTKIWNSGPSSPPSIPDPAACATADQCPLPADERTFVRNQNEQPIGSTYGFMDWMIKWSEPRGKG
jgi:Ca2+-binding RTX toxin-like protein